MRQAKGEWNVTTIAIYPDPNRTRHGWTCRSETEPDVFPARWVPWGGKHAILALACSSDEPGTWQICNEGKWQDWVDCPYSFEPTREEHGWEIQPDGE